MFRCWRGSTVAFRDVQPRDLKGSGTTRLSQIAKRGQFCTTKRVAARKRQDRKEEEAEEVPGDERAKRTKQVV